MFDGIGEWDEVVILAHHGQIARINDNVGMERGWWGWGCGCGGKLYTGVCCLGLIGCCCCCGGGGGGGEVT